MLEDLRQRAADTYDRGAAARAALFIVLLVVFWAGMGVIWLAPAAVHPVAVVLWLLVVGAGAAWVVLPNLPCGRP